MDPSRRQQVVIVGAGFGGLWTARALADGPADVLLLDRNNFHTFWPLLYQVGAAEIEATEIAYPVRSALRKHSNVRFQMAEAEELDTDQRILRTRAREIPYDILVLALGSTPHFFGVPGGDRHAFPLKTLDDGLELRNRILSRFELAAAEPNRQHRRRLLTFVIVGGGTTGVELAGALAELIRSLCRRDYTELRGEPASVIIVEALDTLLAEFPADLGSYARTRLTRMGVQVRLSTKVDEVTRDSVRLADGGVIETETVIWTAGVRGHPLAKAWGLPTSPKGTVVVEATLQARGVPHVYVVGDLAHLEQDGAPLPMIAPVAIQQAKIAARNIVRELRGGRLESFRYREPGRLAVIGRNKAVAQIKGRTLTGFLAWVLWAGTHIAKLIGFRNKLLVLINWLTDYLFYERAVRLVLPFHEVSDVTDDAAQEPEWRRGNPFGARRVARRR